MSRAVVYYCGGIKPVIELLVSIYSLRKFYSGEIIVVLGQTSLPYVPQLLKDKSIKTVTVPNSGSDRRRRQHWRTRWVGMDLIDRKKILHPDCDTVFINGIDDLFDKLHPDPEYMNTFDNLNDGKMYPQWQKHLNQSYYLDDPKFNEKPLYMEFGLIGWRGHWKYAKEVARCCGFMKDDQTALSYVLMKNGRKGHKPETDWPVIRRVRGYSMLSKNEYHNTRIWHTVPNFAVWWEAALPAIKENFMNLGDMKYLKLINKEVHDHYVNGNYPAVNFWKKKHVPGYQRL